MLLICSAIAGGILWRVVPATRETPAPGLNDTGVRASAPPGSFDAADGLETARDMPAESPPNATDAPVVAPPEAPRSDTASPGANMSMVQPIHWAGAPASGMRPETDAKRAELASELARLEKASMENPADLAGLSRLATLQMKMGLWSSAIEPLTTLAAAKPDDAEVRFNLAIATQACGRLSDARRCWDRVLELSPQNLDAFAYRGEVLLDLREYAAAEADLRTVVAQRPDDTAAQLNLALALKHQSRAAEALAVVEALLSRAPRNVPALVRAASLALDLAAESGPPDRRLLETARQRIGELEAIAPASRETLELRERLGKASGG
ncbi:MAG: tetratricopeptide repeat protein [Planctomycetes bacterium]|nr:tetratricopeptide repeat protein [Planctomycetota bacterium]